MFQPLLKKTVINLMQIVMNKLSIMVASIHNEIKLHYKYNISYEKTWVAKQKVIENLIGSHEESLRKIT